MYCHSKQFVPNNNVLINKNSVIEFESEIHLKSQDGMESKIELPNTRFYGSKRRMVEAIWCVLAQQHIEFESFLDIFGGTGIVSYYMLKRGKRCIYNDIFEFNCVNARALLATPKNTLCQEEVMGLFEQKENIIYRSIIEDNYKGIYYLDSENKQIDTIVQNINLMSAPKAACAFYILNQSCLIKRPFNLFHRNNLNLRLNHTTSRFGNYVTWEKSFSMLFSQFTNELNKFQFEEVPNVEILNKSALNCQATADLVYIDTPYFNNDSSITYHSRYHFLEGLQHYSEIEDNINNKKRNKEILINKNTEFEVKSEYVSQLKELLNHYRHTTIAMSYTTKGFPTIDELVEIIKEFKKNVSVHSLGLQPFALNRNNEGREEVLIIGK